LQIFRRELKTGLLVSSDIWSDLVIYVSISHYRFW